MNRPVRTRSGPTLTDTAYVHIERMIIHGEIEPLTFVSEADFMEWTGLGRTPVREAVHRLARERMVEIHPSRGILIPEISVESELRILEMRRVLDPWATRLACERATPGERDEMRDLAETLGTENFTLSDYSETVRQTHGLILRAAHNEYLHDAMVQLQNLSRRFWTSHVTDQAEVTAGATLHRAMLTAIVREDAKEGERAATNLNDYLVDFARRVLAV